jgi:hypothetical protein
MAKAARKRKSRSDRIGHAELVDATPERLAKGDEQEFVNPATIDSSEQRIGLVRRFKATTLDRLHKNGAITPRQFDAGDWLREQYERCAFEGRVTASFDEPVSGGEPAYCLARTEFQARCREVYRAALKQLPAVMLGYTVRLVVHDQQPRYGGNQYYRTMRELGLALDRLGDWLMLPC